MADLRRDWSAEHRRGEWLNLARPEEQGRLALIAGLAKLYARDAVVDVGCGAGHLSAWLDPVCFRLYVGVDVTPDAFADPPPATIVRRWSAEGLEGFRPASPLPHCALVVSELVYYLADPGPPLVRLARELAAGCVIIANAEPGDRRPGYRRRIAAGLSAMADAGWTPLATYRLEGPSGWEGAAAAWTIAAFATHNPT